MRKRMSIRDKVRFLIDGGVRFEWFDGSRVQYRFLSRKIEFRSYGKPETVISVSYYEAYTVLEQINFRAS